MAKAALVPETLGRVRVRAVSPARATASHRPVPWVRRQGLAGYLMVAPSVLGLALFQFSPLIWAMTESVQRFNPMTHRATGFVGMANFEQVFADGEFWRSALNTIAYGVIITAIEIPLALGIAVLLNSATAGTRFARAAVISALAVSESVTALLWFTILNQDTGLMNSVLTAVGIPKVAWLTSIPESMIAVIMVSIWKDIGLPVLIFLSGLQSLDEDLYSASALDGASRWQQFRYLTVPLLQGSTVVAVFMVTITATRIFTPIIIMTAGGPNGSSSNLIYYAYVQGFQNLDYGVGSAATVCMIVLLVIITAVQGLVLRGRNR